MEAGCLRLGGGWGGVACEAAAAASDGENGRMEKGRLTNDCVYTGASLTARCGRILYWRRGGG